MRLLSGLFLLVLITYYGAAITDAANDYVNEWAVHVLGGEEYARQVAQGLGLTYGGKVSQSISDWMQ